MFFLYVHKDAALYRITVDKEPAYSEAAGYGKTDFKSWWASLSEEARAARLNGAQDGQFIDESPNPATGEIARITCSLEDGEPITVADEAPTGEIVVDEVAKVAEENAAAAAAPSEVAPDASEQAPAPSDAPAV